jgi:hypothetical protein
MLNHCHTDTNDIGSHEHAQRLPRPQAHLSMVPRSPATEQARPAAEPRSCASACPSPPPTGRLNSAAHTERTRRGRLLRRGGGGRLVSVDVHGELTSLVVEAPPKSIVRRVWITSRGFKKQKTWDRRTDFIKPKTSQEIEDAPNSSVRKRVSVCARER